MVSLNFLQHIKGCGIVEGELIVRPLIAIDYLVVSSNGLAKLFEYCCPIKLLQAHFPLHQPSGYADIGLRNEKQAPLSTYLLDR